MPDSLPPLPPGWLAQWDHNQRRWYYAEPATGRTQWERPIDHSQGDGERGYGGGGYGGAPPYGGQPGYDDGQFHGYGGGHGGEPQYGGEYPQGQYPQEYPSEQKSKSSSDKKKMMMGAAGGLAAGAIGGALIANALGKWAPLILPSIPHSFLPSPCAKGTTPH